MTARYHKFPRFFKSSSFQSNSKQSRAKSYASSIQSSEISRADDLAGLLHATRSKKCLRRLHARLAVMGAMRDVFVVAGTVERYLFFGSPASAAAVFAWAYRRRPVVYCLNVVVRCFSDYGFHGKLLGLYREVLGFGSNKYTFPPVIKACAAVCSVRLGKEVHCKVLRTGHGDIVGVRTAILDMYAKTGQTDVLRRVFDGMTCRDLVSWNAMISGYSLNGCLREAVEALKHLQQDGFRPNASSLVGVVSVSRGLGAKDLGVSLHAFALKSGVLGDESLTPAFISIDFFGISLGESVHGMIIKFGLAEQALAAFDYFRQMRFLDVKNDEVTIVAIISAISQLGKTDLAQCVMAHTLQKGFDGSTIVFNALIDMHSRCGNISFARKLFDSFMERDSISWSTMINAYSMHGDGGSALDLFLTMVASGVKPNDITFVSILSACSHSGFLEQGRALFESLHTDHGITPKMKHYACMVDLLGRTGHLDEAYDIVTTMPLRPSESLLVSLLGACRLHGNSKIGESVGKLLTDSEHGNPRSYVMLSNIYASAGKWSDHEQLRSNMDAKGLIKDAGVSLIGAT
ncbi:hypothetical protein GUJ93_ZPchr0006g45095 [Zizania palustris]|uniref:Pentatricopeptide repeat-containing protein n=1 Tax=Zizania palustris TaxID=103762 RepID=A0A8J5VX18_ZIZPA|nr:hypothetical protein GUJ93_ZPchr0006g45095 [Zizania palustris]